MRIACIRFTCLRITGFFLLAFACLTLSADEQPTPDTAAEKTVTLLPLGDSITAGGGGGGGNYRHELDKRLKDAGRSFAFVGPKTDGKGLSHAGYSGWNSSKIRDAIGNIYPQYPADIVLLHMGHNHFSEHDPVPLIVQNTNAILDTIFSQNKHATVLVARVIPAGKLPKYSYIPELNRQLERLCKERQSDSPERVVLVDQASGFDWTTDTVADKVHPNADGAAKMAEVWAAMILAL
ncbi:GDSL-type esterase/lipase family protein [Novipirellula sp. SH528]|uniref:GDSL-type esterase/lipase family protein n=1 Tax=Novipirellula sp. SH528 TaxID=3454466 RepID=UPI003FA09F2B